MMKGRQQHCNSTKVTPATTINSSSRNEFVTVESIGKPLRTNFAQEDKGDYQDKHCLIGSVNKNQPSRHCEVEFYGLDDDDNSNDEAGIILDDDFFDPFFNDDFESDLSSPFQSVAFHAGQSRDESISSFTSFTSGASQDILQNSSPRLQSSLTLDLGGKEEFAHQNLSNDNEKHENFSQSTSSLRGTLQKNPRDTLAKSERANRSQTRSLGCSRSARRHSLATLPPKQSESSSSLSKTSTSTLRRSCRTITRRLGRMRPGSSNVVSQKRDLSRQLPWSPVSPLQPKQKSCSSAVSPVVTPSTTQAAYSNSSGPIKQRPRLSFQHLAMPSLVGDDGVGDVTGEQSNRLQLEQTVQHGVGVKINSNSSLDLTNHAHLPNERDSDVNTNAEDPLKQHIFNDSQQTKRGPGRPQGYDQVTVGAIKDSNKRTNESKKSIKNNQKEVSQLDFQHPSERRPHSHPAVSSDATTTPGVVEKNAKSAEHVHDDFGKLAQKRHFRRHRRHSCSHIPTNAMSNVADKKVCYNEQDESILSSERRDSTLSLLKCLSTTAHQTPLLLPIKPTSLNEDLQGRCRCRCRCRCHCRSFDFDAETNDVDKDISSKRKNVLALSCQHCHGDVPVLSLLELLAKAVDEAILISSQESDDSEVVHCRGCCCSTGTLVGNSKWDVDDHNTLAAGDGKNKNESNTDPFHFFAPTDYGQASQHAIDSNCQHDAQEYEFLGLMKSLSPRPNKPKKHGRVISNCDWKEQSTGRTTGQAQELQKISFAELEKWIPVD